MGAGGEDSGRPGRGQRAGRKGDMVQKIEGWQARGIEQEDKGTGDRGLGGWQAGGREQGDRRRGRGRVTELYRNFNSHLISTVSNQEEA